jgi:hypothetical protein
VEVSLNSSLLANYTMGKGYADKYRSYGLPIHLIGVEFSREARNVVGFEVA